MTHPKIKDVAIVGIPNEKYGELPVAFVVKIPNVNLIEQEVMEYVSGS